MFLSSIPGFDGIEASFRERKEAGPGVLARTHFAVRVFDRFVISGSLSPLRRSVFEQRPETTNYIILS